MADTSYVVSPEKLPRVVTVHRRMDGKLVEQPNAPTERAPVRGDGGLYSTARDYGTFLQMLLNGGSLRTAKLLGEKSVRMMGENQIGVIAVEEQPAADPDRTRPFPLGAGHDKFGLGFQIAARDERYAKLRSPGSLSWAGINNTHFWIDPNRRIAVVVLMQVLP
jgi:methyl acetate hydrolase